MIKYTFLDIEIPGGLGRQKWAYDPERLNIVLADVSAESILVESKKLTKNEFYCLVLAAQGLTSMETSKVLSLAKETVETHRKKIRSKLKSKNMAHAVFQGIRYELAGLESSGMSL